MNNADIKYAQPGATLNDDQVTGLSLRCLSTKKSWSLFYRVNGQQRRPTIGTWPTMSLADARELAREMLLQVARGLDPSAQKQAARTAPTMLDLWLSYATGAASKKTFKEDQRLWNKHIAPAVHAAKVADIGLTDVAAVHKSLAATPYQANRVLALFSCLLNHGEALGWRANGSNPCRHVKRFKEHKRRRYMTGEEAARVAERLRAYTPSHPQAVAFIYLLILTGARKSEIAKAHWFQVQGHKMVLAEHKTDGHGDRTIFLPDVVVELLATLPRTTGAIVGIADPKALWEKVRVEAGCPDLRLHDLRHSFASVALSAGLSLAQIGELLGHRDPKTTARYAHLIDEAAQRAANQTAGELSRMMGATAPR